MTERDTSRRAASAVTLRVSPDSAEALAFAVEEAEAGFDGVAGAFVECAEEFVEEVAVDHRHDGVFGGARRRWR